MSVYGLMIINTETGKLIYERDYTDCKFGLMKDSGKPGASKESLGASFADPLNLSALIYSMLKFQEASFTDSSPSNRVLKISGSTDLLFEYSKTFPLVMVVFYSGFESELIQDTASKLLDVFVSKYERKAISSDAARFTFSSADKLFLPIYEDLVIQSIKSFVLDLYNLNLYVPWVYICLLAQPKVPIVQESMQGSFFVPVESASITGNKAKIIEPSSMNGLSSKGAEECKMRSTVKGETRFDTLKKMKLSSLLKFTSKVTAKKVATGYQRGELCNYEMLLKIHNEELKMESANGEVSNDIMLCESHQIYIKSCQDVKAKSLDTITHLLQTASKLLSPNTGSFRYLDFTLNKQGIELSKSRMTVLAYKSLMIAIPTEALNEKVNMALVVANNKDLIMSLESLVNFYVEQHQAITKSEKHTT